MPFRDPEIRPGIRRLFQLAARRDERIRQEADDEIRLHLRLRVDQLVREGWTLEAARAEAERRFGPMAEAREDLHKSSRRREGRLRFREWIDTVRQDLRYSMRTLRREAGFTTFAILIVGLGIGATATVFSVVNAVLLRPLPFRDPASLVPKRSRRFPAHGDPHASHPVPYRAAQTDFGAVRPNGLRLKVD